MIIVKHKKNILVDKHFLNWYNRKGLIFGKWSKYQPINKKYI